MFLTYVGYYFLYGSLIASCNTNCVASGGYHGGMNMHRLGANHPNHLTCGFNGGLLGGSPPSELPPNESPSCLPSSE